MQTFLPLIIHHFHYEYLIFLKLVPYGLGPVKPSCLSELPSSFIIGNLGPLKIDPFCPEWPVGHQLSFDFMQPFVIVLHLPAQQASSFSWHPSSIFLVRRASSVQLLHAR